MSPVTFESACINYAAWLGAMLERIARGKRPHPKAWDAFAIMEEASSRGAEYVDEDGYYEPRHVPAIEALMRRISAAVRGWRYEDNVLVAMFVQSPVTAPSDLVHPVIDRANMNLMGSLAHHVFDDDVQWRLTDWDNMSIYILARRRYEHPKYEIHRFEEVLYAFPRPDVVNQLRSHAPSTPEKADLLVQYASTMQDRGDLLLASHGHNSDDYREAIERWQARNA